MSKIKVAILDDYQNAARSCFSRLSDRIEIFSFFDTLNAKDADQRAALIRRLERFTVVSTMRERTAFQADLVKHLPNLKLILTTGPGNAAIDMQACTECGVLVTGTTGFLLRQPKSLPVTNALVSTTEQTWALILGATRKLVRDDAAVKAGRWQGSFAIGLTGKTLGVLGLGRLGVMTAKIAAAAFNMKILAWSTNLTQEDADEKAKQVGLAPGAFVVAGSKMDLFRAADILSVHYVLSERSKGIVGAEELAAMKPTSYLINTSRGPLIDEAALLEHLKAGKITGVALDVFDMEPLPADSEWRTVEWGRNGRSEVVLSPHMGYAEDEVILSWYEEQADSLERWLDGRDQLLAINKIT